MSTVLSPSRTDSSTPVTIIVCETFQLAAVNTKVVVDKLTSAVLGLVMISVTLEAGFRSKTTLIEAVTVPDSLTVINPIGLMLNPASFGSI